MTKLKPRSQKFRMNKYLRMPTTGTGVPVVTRSTCAGHEINYNIFGGHVKMLEDHTKITLEQVTAYACYNWGANGQTRVVIEPTKVDGFVLLKKILMDIRPEIVVYVQDKEKLLEPLTLEKCGNNVQTLTGTLEKTWNEIKNIKPGTYDESRFLTQLFRALKTSTNDDFLRPVKNMGDLWIKSNPSITAVKVAADANQYYKTLVNTDEWNKMSEDKTILIALTTKVNELSKKNQQLESNLKSNSRGNSGNNSGKEKKSNSSSGVQ
jgi:hypothetical protein